MALHIVSRMPLRHNGAAIRAIRERHGLSLSQLAAEIGIHKGTLSRIERQRISTDPANIRAIADRLRVPLDAITYPLGDDDKVPA